VANILTFGIYTPMTIEVQCATAASGGEHAEALARAPHMTARDALAMAAQASLESGAPVYVDID
jgi:hypothetical protein